MAVRDLNLFKMKEKKAVCLRVCLCCLFPVNVAFGWGGAWKFSYCPRLLYSAALLHMDQAALYRAMKALRLILRILTESIYC